MKPGNLLFKVPNPAATKDEDSILKLAHIGSSVCAFCMFVQACTIPRIGASHVKIVIYRTGAAAPLALPLGELSAEQAD